MTIIALIPALVALAGALVFAASAQPKLSELGRLAFVAGLLALMFALAEHKVRLG